MIVASTFMDRTFFHSITLHIFYIKGIVKQKRKKVRISIFLYLSVHHFIGDQKGLHMKNTTRKMRTVISLLTYLPTRKIPIRENFMRKNAHVENHPSCKIPKWKISISIKAHKNSIFVEDIRLFCLLWVTYV